MKLELDLTNEEAELLAIFAAVAHERAIQDALVKSDPELVERLAMMRALDEKVRAAVLPGLPDMMKAMAEAAP